MIPIYSLARRLWPAWAALLSTAAFADRACDKQPVEAGHIQAIGRDMVINGVPASILSVEFAGSPDEVSNEFRAFWKREDVPAKGVRTSSGLVLSALDGACHYVLTIPSTPEGARTRGVLSVTRLGSGAAHHQIPDSAVPLPEGRTITDVESRDPGQAGRTWLIQMSGRSGDNARNYGSSLSQQGWSTVAQSPVWTLDGSQRALGSALVMQHGNDRIDAIFSDHGGQTEAVVNATRNR
jgi:hypothetical protein